MTWSEDIEQWRAATFGNSTPGRIWRRFIEEFGELTGKMLCTDSLIDELFQRDLAEEAADCVIVLAGWVYNQTGHDLATMVEQKMAKNKARQWNVTADGVGYHVKGEASPEHTAPDESQAATARIAELEREVEDQRNAYDESKVTEELEQATARADVNFDALEHAQARADAAERKLSERHCSWVPETEAAALRAELALKEKTAAAYHESESEAAALRATVRGLEKQVSDGLDVRAALRAEVERLRTLNRGLGLEVTDARARLAAATALLPRAWEAMGELTSFVVDGEHMVRVDEVRGVFERFSSTPAPSERAQKDNDASQREVCLVRSMGGGVLGSQVSDVVCVPAADVVVDAPPLSEQAPSLGHPGADEVFARLRQTRERAAAERKVLEACAALHNNDLDWMRGLSMGRRTTIRDVAAAELALRAVP